MNGEVKGVSEAIGVMEVLRELFGETPQRHVPQFGRMTDEAPQHEASLGSGGNPELWYRGTKGSYGLERKLDEATGT